MTTLKSKFRKCLECKSKFIPFTNTQVVCTALCGSNYARKKREKKEAEEWNERKSEMKDRLKTHSDWASELQDLINEIARLIDKGQPCISCQKSTGSQRHGGHRWRTSTYPEIRFHLDNVASQCVYCNDHLSGNPNGYDEGLRLFYGEEYFFFVKHGLKINHKTTKLTIPELIEAKARAKKIVKALKALDLVYTPELRIELRRKYNEKIGIYKNG